MDSFEVAKPTFLENWPDALSAMTIDQVGLPLSPDEIDGLGGAIVHWSGGFNHGMGNAAALWRLLQRVRESMMSFPQGAFIRLGSRSPKDSWMGPREGWRVSMADVDQLRFIKYSSQRIAEDLLASISHQYQPWLWLREWLPLQHHMEFRCFMHRRKLVGISQYFYKQQCPQICERPKAYEGCIRGLFARFEKVCHLDDVVFDVVVREVNKKKLQAILLEINPWQDDPTDQLTDPCLFRWDDRFDGSFRYVEAPVPEREPIDLSNIAEEMDNE